MDVVSPSWFSQLGMEDPLLPDQCNIMDSSFDEELAAALGEDYINSLSPESNSSSSTLCASPSNNEALPQNIDAERPTKQRKPNNYNPCPINNNILTFDKSSSASFILNFANSNIQPEQKEPLGASKNQDDEALPDVFLSQGTLANQLDDAIGTISGQGTKRVGGRSRPPSQTYDHIIAERKRREQLSQRFVALSAIVPGLKKMDKTSVLGDAISYLKQLQERVKTLEEQSSKKTMESVVLIKRSHVSIDDEGSSDENSLGSSSDPLPEIEARTCGKSVLLRIHCEKYKGVLLKILSEIEKMNLAVVNTSISSFGSLALDITVIAEMEKEFCVPVKDIVTNLRSVVCCVKETN